MIKREEFISGPLRPLVFDQIDHKRWTEIVEEEQAKTGEEDGDDDLFEDLKQEERRRLNQAEMSR